MYCIPRDRGRSGLSRKALGVFSSLLLVVLVAIAFTFSPSFAQDCWDHSLRLLTYNTAFLATGDSNQDIFMMSDRNRARIIANRIFAQNVDVVAFQEVFADSAKEEFKRILSTKFPYIVYKLDAPGLEQDSGLMLFSRYPFVPLPKKIHQIANLAAHAGTRTTGGVTALGGSLAFANGKPSTDTAFIKFKSSTDWDSLANKGVGLARIRIPCTGQYATIVFTHLQASYDDCAGDEQKIAAIRMSQLDDVKRIILESLHQSQLKTDQIFFMGDLNINGNPWNMKEMLRSDLPKCGGSGRVVPPSAWKPGLSEWSFHFDPKLNRGSFFAGTLTDTWAFNTSPQDVGQTSGGGPGDGTEAFPYYPNKQEGFRFDYMLHSKPEMQTCMQHITRAYRLADTDGTHYSDHVGVKLDVNRTSQYCNPRIPHANPATNKQINGIIQYQGSMQWYRIDQPGSYSIETRSIGGAVDFDVYEASDLSRPLAPYYGERTEWGLKFPMPKPPYYIRAYAKDRSWVGLYKIGFHRHQGKSHQDSLDLLPAQPYPYTMPIQPLNDENAVWFIFYTGKSANNEFPNLRFYLDYYKDHSFDIKLLEGNARKQLHVNQTRNISTKYPEHIRREFSLNNLPEGKYFLVVRPGRNSTQVHGQTFHVEWQTNLTYFHPVQLKCNIQDDTFGDDEIHYQLEVDGKPLGGYKFLSDFDETTAEPVDQIFGVLGFTNEFTVRLMEEDSGLNFGDDYWGPQSVKNLPYENPGCESCSFEWSRGSTYKYHLHGNLCRAPVVYRQDE